MTREQAIPYVSYVVDDSLDASRHLTGDPLPEGSRLVGWQCGFEPMFVAVHSYLPGVVLDEADAEDIATDYLEAIDWFTDGRVDADYVI